MKALVKIFYRGKLKAQRCFEVDRLSLFASSAKYIRAWVTHWEKYSGLELTPVISEYNDEPEIKFPKKKKEKRRYIRMGKRNDKLFYALQAQRRWTEHLHKLKTDKKYKEAFERSLEEIESEKKSGC